MKEINTEKILLVAIGNNARGDDGLGWAFADRISLKFAKNINLEYRYQLQIEDTLLVCGYDTVIFIDASEEVFEEGYCLKACNPADHYFYSSHQQSPETIMYLARQLYQCQPRAFTLAISGYQWNLGEELSIMARQNLEKALCCLESMEFRPNQSLLASN